MLQEWRLYCESDEVDLTAFHLPLAAPMLPLQVKPHFEGEASAAVTSQRWLKGSSFPSGLPIRWPYRPLESLRLR